MFKPEILAVLRDGGGRLEQDDVFDELETRMGERLTAADRELTPEGELRWRYAARRARQALIAEGEMDSDRAAAVKLPRAPARANASRPVRRSRAICSFMAS